jgi:hypothetical protein
MLCGIAVMVMRFDKLEADLLRSEVRLDHFRCLIIHYIYLWFVTFAGEIYVKFLMYVARMLALSRPGMGVARMAFVS